jgi:hypothetical protein
MPPVVLALAAAAGFVAAARIVAAIMGPPAPEQMQSAKPHNQTPAADIARDLGQLEWDAASGVYRPKA